MSDVVTYTPGTCGEWIQGWQDGDPVLVSCPINRWSTVSLKTSPGKELKISPHGLSKAYKAARHFSARFHSQKERGYDIQIENRLPHSRGYGSSTADVVGVIAALAAADGLTLSPQDYARLACKVEPSDSVMFPGWNLLAYHTGDWSRNLGSGLTLPLVILDPGAEVDTVAYNQQLDLRRIAHLETETRAALEILDEGMRQNDWRLLGKAAQLSAMAYQKISYSELVSAAADWAVALGGAGPLRAHSGSIVGILFESDEAALHGQKWLEGVFKREIFMTSTVQGGVQICNCPSA